MKIPLFFVLLSTVLLCQSVLADICGTSISKKSNTSYDWCIDHTDRAKNPDILFYFHGIMGSEKTWQNTFDNARVRSHWNSLGQQAPTVISISFGRKWLLTEVQTSKKSFNVFKDEILPELEQKVGGLTFNQVVGFDLDKQQYKVETHSGRRLLMGMSMGGFNASQMLFKTNLFEKVALICPALTRIGPNSSKAEIDDYIQRNNASKLKVYTVVQLNKQEFKSESDWLAHSPLILAENHTFKESTQVLISCGKQDEYGFFEGYNDFLNTTRKQNFNIEAYEVEGDHCSFDPIKTAEFFVR